MINDRIEQLADEVRAFVFNLLDGEPELTGDDAGMVAARCEAKFKLAMWELASDIDMRKWEPEVVTP